MAASRKDFLLCSVLHLGALSLWLLITVSGWLLRFLIASKAWRGCEGFFITELSLAGILCSVSLLDCIQIGPNDDAGLTWFGLFLCAMRAPSRQHTTAADHWPPPSAVRCSGEVSRCLMTLASRNKVGSKPSCTPPPYDASSPACCWTVLRGSWRPLLPQYPECS